MADPSQMASAFEAGPTLTADQVDVDNDLIPYFRSRGDGTFELCTISPADLYTAMSV